MTAQDEKKKIKEKERKKKKPFQTSGPTFQWQSHHVGCRKTLKGHLRGVLQVCSPHKDPLFSPILAGAQQEASSLIDLPSESSRIDWPPY